MSMAAKDFSVCRIPLIFGGGVLLWVSMIFEEVVACYKRKVIPLPDQSSPLKCLLAMASVVVGVAFLVVLFLSNILPSFKESTV